MAAWLVIRGHLVNCRRVHRLMRLTGLAAIYQRPNTRKPTATHKVYPDPDLLDRLEIERGQSRLMLGRHPAFWRCRLYIPMAKDFLYLVAIIHWVSPSVLAWRLLNTLGAHVFMKALEEALARYGRPELFNTCKRCGGASGEDKASPSLETPTEYPMPHPNDLNRSLVALDRDSTLIEPYRSLQSHKIDRNGE